MRVIYLTVLSSKHFINKISADTGLNPGYAGQKFNRLIVEGLTKNGVDTKTLTSRPMNRRFSKKLFWNASDEIEDGIHYQYIPFINIPYVHHICLFMYTFFYMLFWGSINKKRSLFLWMF